MSGEAKYKLNIRSYIAHVKIGVALHERETRQKISYDIAVLFDHMPESCESDDISGSYCYAHICNIVKEIATKKEYASLEHLGYCCYKAIKKFVGTSKLNISTTKLSPPIDGLENGAMFSIEEFN